MGADALRRPVVVGQDPTTPSIVGSAIDASALARERRSWLPDDGGKVTSATDGSIAWLVCAFVAITDPRDPVVSTTSDPPSGNAN